MRCSINYLSLSEFPLNLSHVCTRTFLASLYGASDFAVPQSNSASLRWSPDVMLFWNIEKSLCVGWSSCRISLCNGKGYIDNFCIVAWSLFYRKKFAIDLITFKYLRCSDGRPEYLTTRCVRLFVMEINIFPRLNLLLNI